MSCDHKNPVIGIIMGSESDMLAMEPCMKQLEEFGVPYEVKVASAHRKPAEVHEWASTAHERGIKVIIAAAGKAAHLGRRGCRLHPRPGYRRSHEDKRPGRPGFAAVHGADALRRAGCHRRHQRREERGHLGGADHGHRLQRRSSEDHRYEEGHAEA